MEQLPEELLLEIFGYLTLKEIFSLSLTNRHFHKIISKSKTLWQSLAVSLTNLQSEISSPLKNLKNETIVELKAKVCEAWKRLAITRQRMRFGGNHMEQSKTFDDDDSILIIKINAEMTKLLVYFESGWIQIYELETFSQSSHPVTIFKTYLGIETIHFLSHSLVLYPSLDCANCASFWKFNHEGEYGKTQCTDMWITSWHVNDHYLISLADYLEEQHLFFYHRCNRKFQDAETKFSLTNLKNIALSKNYLAIYITTQAKNCGDHVLKIFNLGDPDKFCGFDESLSLKFSIVIQHLTGSVSHDPFRQVSKENFLDQFDIQPPHCNPQFQRLTTMFGFWVGPWDDGMNMFKLMHSDHDVYVSFSSCSGHCPICQVGSFKTHLDLDTTSDSDSDSYWGSDPYQFIELQKGFGYIYSIKSRVTLCRFDFF